jgi:TRAP-type C4-dicarboxylate transport system permease small subunit
MRYFVGKPITWGEEITLGMYVWMVMLGAAYVIQKNASIKLDFLMQKLPPTIRKVQLILVALVTMVFYVFLSYFAFRLMGLTKNRTGVFKIHYQFIYASIIIGAVFIVVYLIKQMIHIAQGKPLDLTYSPEEAAETEAIMSIAFEDIPVFNEANSRRDNSSIPSNQGEKGGNL